MKKITTLIALALLPLVAPAQNLDRSIRPQAAPAKEIKIKDAETFTLPNGLKVFVVEDHRTPIVYYSLSLDIRPALEGDKAGLQDVFAGVFGKATASRSKEQLSRELDLIGARAELHSRGAYITFLTKYEQRGLELLADALFHPVFRQEEFDLNVEQQRSSLALIADDASSLNERLSRALVYGSGFPSGELESIESIESITLADLQTYYNTYFAPNVARLVIVGDVTKAQAKANAEKYFGRWKRKTVPEARYVLPELPKATSVAMISRPGAVQSTLDISYPVPYSIGAPDEVAASVMSYILGGGMSGRLFLNLREQRSYTYGIYSRLSKGEQVGRFSLTSGRGAASVKASVTDSALVEIFKEIDLLIQTPVSDEELRNAKAYLAGDFGRDLAEASTIAQYALNIDKYKLPKDYYKTYLKRLNDVTVADVQAAARKYLRPENAWIVVAGDPSYAERLNRFAANGTVQFYDLNARPTEAPSLQPADVAPDALIDRYVQAVGGAEAIGRINDCRITGEMAMMGQTVIVEQHFKQPNLSVTSMSMSGMLLQKVAFDGVTLRTSDMQGVSEETEGPAWDEISRSGSICPEWNYAKDGNTLINYANDAYTLTVKGIEKVDGREAYVLEKVRGANVSTDYFDVATGLKVKSVATAETPDGAEQTVTEYSDYRAVDGVLFPFLTKQSMAGMKMEIIVKTIETNTGLDPALFR